MDLLTFITVAVGECLAYLFGLAYLAFLSEKNEE